MYLGVSWCILMYLDVYERDTSRYTTRYFKIHQDTYRIGNYTKSYRKLHVTLFGPSPPQPRRAARRARSSGPTLVPSPAAPAPRSLSVLRHAGSAELCTRGENVKSTKFAIAGAKRKNEMLSKFVTHDSKLWPRNFLWQPFETLAYPNHRAAFSKAPLWRRCLAHWAPGTRTGRGGAIVERRYQER